MIFQYDGELFSEYWQYLKSKNTKSVTGNSTSGKSPKNSSCELNYEQILNSFVVNAVRHVLGLFQSCFC